MNKTFLNKLSGHPTRVNEDNCQYKDFSDCPYSKRSDCPNLKKNCYLPENDEEEENRYYDSGQGICLSVISILLIIFPIIAKECINCHVWNIVFDCLLSFGISLFAGVILAKIVNIPQNLDDFTQIVTTSLSSFRYLRSLTKEQLISLRNRVTFELHTKNLPNMPQGLLRLDKKVCDLLSKPYYKVYREIIQCHNEGDYNDVAFGYTEQNDIKAGQKFFWKEVTQEYTIKNPYGKQTPIKADIGIRNHIFLTKGCRIQNVFKIDSYQISIDGHPYVNIMNALNVVYNNHTKCTSDIDPNTTTYNTGLYVMTKDEKVISLEYLNSLSTRSSDSSDIGYESTDSAREMLVLFNDTVSVKFKYKQVIPVEDNHFTKRLKYSTKSYRLDYFSEDNVQLFGQLLGTLIDQSQVAVNQSKDGKHISIESFEWLLPQSGAFVAMGMGGK